MARKKYNMDIDTANDILQNVFAAEKVTPNTIPFDMIVLKGMAQTLLVRVCILIASVMLTLLLLAPLAFRSTSDFKVSEGSAHEISIMEHQLYETEFIMLIKGKDIDYTKVYARKNDGSVIFPTRIQYVNSNTEITFPYDGEALNLYIPDMDGHVLQAVLSQR